MYYEFYIDQFFAEQCVIGFFLLAVTQGLLGISLTWRTFLGSLINAVTMIICILFHCFWLYPPGFLAMAVLVFLSKTPPGGWRYLFRCILCLLTVTLCFGGALEVLMALLPTTLIIAAAGACGIVYGLLRAERQKRQRDGKLAKVVLFLDGANIELTGLWDTGNQLTEPVTGRPVSIANTQVLTGLLGIGWEEKRGFCLIPYHSLGVTKGWLRAVTFDEMHVTMRREEDFLIRGSKPSHMVCSRPLIAMYDGRVSAQDDYQIILHPEHVP